MIASLYHPSLCCPQVRDDNLHLISIRDVGAQRCEFTEPVSLCKHLVFGFVLFFFPEIYGGIYVIYYWFV